MRNGQRLTICSVFLLIVLLLMISCQDNGSDSGQGEEVTSFNGPDYFPLHRGNVWVYIYQDDFGNDLISMSIDSHESIGEYDAYLCTVNFLENVREDRKFWIGLREGNLFYAADENEPLFEPYILPTAFRTGTLFTHFILFFESVNMVKCMGEGRYSFPDGVRSRNSVVLHCESENSQSDPSGEITIEFIKNGGLAAVEGHMRLDDFNSESISFSARLLDYFISRE